jgi:hypothetical protein
MFDMTGKAKWQAWMDIKGKTKEAAEQEYMDVCQGFSDISFGAQPVIALHDCGWQLWLRGISLTAIPCLNAVRRRADWQVRLCVNQYQFQRSPEESYVSL